MCNEAGGIIDDLTVCRLAADHFLLVVNASNIDKDFTWIRQHLKPGAEAHDVSDANALLAIQGPDAEAILQRLTTANLPQLRYYHALPATLDGLDALVFRTGYTGEDGFEILVDAPQAPTLWQALMRAGQNVPLLPVGLGARDTLRLEARYLLYGTDMDETTNPFEVGLTDYQARRGDFIGREALSRLPQRACRGAWSVVMQERVYGALPLCIMTSPLHGDQWHCPRRRAAIGTALVHRDYAS
jgi:aminomethyltransferase